MPRRSMILSVAFGLAVATSSAQAVVYCTSAGYPAGCVVRPAPAAKVIYCTAPGVPVGCVARPARAAGAAAAAVTPGVGAPGRGVVDPGINQPGAIGNRGGGAPGAGVVDPGINQPARSETVAVVLPAPVWSTRASTSLVPSAIAAALLQVLALPASVP